MSGTQLDQPADRWESWARRLTAPLLVLVTLLSFEGVRHCEILQYDDDVYVTWNPYVRDGITMQGLRWAWTTFHAGNYHPLTWLSLMLDVQLWGDGPRGLHVGNVVLHALSSVLVFALLRSATGSHWRSAAVAAIFAVHPLRVESVAWVSERKDVLSAALGIAALSIYCRYARQPRATTYLLSIFLFALSLLAKPMLVTMPLLLLLLDFWPLGRLKLRGISVELPAHAPRAAPAALSRILIEKLPFVAIAGVSGVVTIFAQHSGGGVRTTDEMSLALRVANAIVSYARYVGKMFWFRDLSIQYYFPGAWPTWQVAGAVILLAAVTVVALVRVQWRPSLAFGWFWFLGSMLPVIGLLQVGNQSMADRYSYIPCVGLLVMIFWNLPDRLWVAPAARRASAMVMAAVLVMLMIFTHRQVRHWRNDKSLMTHALEVDNRNWFAHRGLGAVLAEEGRPAEAAAHFREALRLNPDYPMARVGLAYVLTQMNQTQEAVEQYRRAAEEDPGDPRASIGLAELLA